MEPMNPGLAYNRQLLQVQVQPRQQRVQVLLPVPVLLRVLLQLRVFHSCLFLLNGPGFFYPGRHRIL
jgi:hypothetical protein